MAKAPKIKNRQPALNSRAARREISPSLAGNIDKSILSAPRPSSFRASVGVTSHAPAGVSKKPSHKGQINRHQRLRRERGIARADQVREQLEVKVLKSGQKERRGKERRKDWEDVNEKTAVAGKASGGIKSAGGFELLADLGATNLKNDIPAVVHMSEVNGTEITGVRVESTPKAVTPGSTSAIQDGQEEDEIL